MATAPPSASGGLDFGRTFTFVSEDPEWIRKILIGGLFVLLSALLVGIPFVAGYYGRTLRNVARGEPRPLPDWDDLGGLFSEGLLLTAVYVVHVFAVMAVFAVLVGVMLLPLVAAGSTNHRGPSDALAALAGLGLMALYGLVMLVSLALAVYLPAAFSRVVMLGTFGCAFDWRRNLLFIRTNAANYLLALLVLLLGGFVAQFGFLLCCVGMFPAAFWAHVTGAVAFGQVVRLNPDSV